MVPRPGVGRLRTILDRRTFVLTQQARDRLRDQTHTASGLIAVRFSHAQIRYEPNHPCAILRRVAERL